MAPSSISSESALAPGGTEQAVLRAVRRVCEGEGLDATAAVQASSLVHHLGLDSFAFVELAVELERELGARDVPLQAWVDEEAAKGDREQTYTIESLTHYMQRFLGRRTKR
jgi:acyl carrier protein